MPPPPNTDKTKKMFRIIYSCAFTGTIYVTGFRVKKNQLPAVYADTKELIHIIDGDHYWNLFKNMLEKRKQAPITIEMMTLSED